MPSAMPSMTPKSSKAHHYNDIANLDRSACNLKVIRLLESVPGSLARRKIFSASRRKCLPINVWFALACPEIATSQKTSSIERQHRIIQILQSWVLQLCNLVIIQIILRI